MKEKASTLCIFVYCLIIFILEYESCHANPLEAASASDDGLSVRPSELWSPGEFHPVQEQLDGEGWPLCGQWRFLSKIFYDYPHCHDMMSE
eukprot:s1104_g40.t1